MNITNVAIISPEFPPHTNWGGIATYNYNLATLLTKLGYKVTVITFGNNCSTLKHKTIENIVVQYVQFKTQCKIFNFIYYKFPLGIIRFVLKKYLPNLLFAIDWNLFSLLSFYSLNKINAFQLIHSPTYHYPGLFISILYPHTKKILHLQGPQQLFNSFEPLSADNQIKAYLEDMYLQVFSEKIVSCSQLVTKQIIKIYPQLTRKVLTIPNFINPSIYKNNKQINLDNIVYWGRIEYRKGVDILCRSFIKIAQTNSNIKLYLIGEQNYSFPFNGSHINLPQLIETWNIAPEIRKRIITFPRIDDKPALIELLQRLKGIAVFPARYEPFGFVTIESMALGYITLASRRGGGKEIIQDNVDGLIINPSEKSVIRAILQVTSYKPQMILKITSAAVNKVKNHYSSTTALKHYQNLY